MSLPAPCGRRLSTAWKDFILGARGLRVAAARAPVAQLASVNVCAGFDALAACGTHFQGLVLDPRRCRSVRRANDRSVRGANASTERSSTPSEGISICQDVETKPAEYCC